jgi:PAS domain S-box-containing protein
MSELLNLVASQCFDADSSKAKSLQQLFDLLPDVYFFAKDTEGRFIMANRLFAELCGAKEVKEVLGKTDWDFFPADRASLYVQDDRRVMGSHVPMINRIEPSPSSRGSASLVITSKVPIAEGGHCKGIAGIARDLNRSEASLTRCSRFEKAIAHIERHYGEVLHIADLARLEGMSVSSFERLFKKAFQITPVSHIKEIRIRHAARLLMDRHLTITEVALACGFYDNSHFTRNFQRAVGLTPTQYRKTHPMEPS